MMSVCPAVACIAALLVACGGEHGDGEAATVTFQAGTFAPSRVEILAGQSVRFVNASESAVRPASHIHPTHAIYPEFDSGRSIPAGESWTFRFERPGYWRYHNHLDAPQTGLVVVRGGGSEGEFPPLRAAHEHVAFDPIGRLPEDVAHALLVDDALLHDFVQTYGPTQVVAVLAEAGARAGLDCHERAHMLGHHAYQDFGAVALAAAGHECHSGAYHGATEAMFRERGTLSLERDVAVVCDAMTNTFFRHQCVHGVGHGLMAWTSYELRDALELCDGVGRALDRESCYSGVFMENVVGGLQGAMGHRTEYLSRDPHFPCNILGPRYVAACYFYQTSHMLNIFRGDFSRVAAACGVLAGFPRRLCFESMGRDVGGRTRHQPERSIGLCASARATQDRRQCLAGAVQDYFWDSAGADPAVRFCRTLTDEPEVRSCYDTIIGRARDILVDCNV
jgi:plastocyanin